MPHITKLFANGGTLADGAAALKISRATFCRMMRRDPAFAEGVNVGREIHRLRRAEMVKAFHAFIEGKCDAAF